MKIFPPVALALFFGCAAALSDDDIQPRNTQKPGEEPPSPEEAVKLITVPEGFQVRLFAGDPDVRQPVAMALDDRGRLFVAESYSYKEWKKTGQDRILIFEDTDNDGRHDSRKAFVSGIDHLSGMTVGWGGVWVCSAPHLLFYPDKDRNDKPDGDPVVVLDGWTTKAGHNFFNGLTWGPDGWLYGRHGITRPSLVGIPGTADDDRVGFDCAIWRYHPRTKDFEVVCRGTTNPWGLDWNDKGDMFFTNNVNGHLWHAIPGAFYPRMGKRADPFAKFVYDRIGMCCDHLHHAGKHTDWTKTRDGKGVHGQLGGGHSHCGGMIYRGGKWPQKYQGRMFMCNTHGRRVNVDGLDEDGPTYVGRHEADFLRANNPWFRGVQLIYGPDGDVFLSDWVDNGECHDNDGVHRTSGRIYKIIYGDPSPPMKKNLWAMTDQELFAIANRKEGELNEWFVRQANWILWERSETPTGILQDDFWKDLVGTIKLYKDNPRFLRKYASYLSRCPRELKWDAARALLETCPDHHETTDLLIYYGIKDIASGDAKKAEQLLFTAEDRHYPFTKNLSQNLAENGVFSPLISMLKSSGNEALSAALLDGFSAGIKGRKNLDAPEDWASVFDSNFRHPDLRKPALAINLVFDEKGSREKIRKLLKGKVESGEPIEALRLLADFPIRELADDVIPHLDSANFELFRFATMVLGKFKDPKIADRLIEKYSPGTGVHVVNCLAENKIYAAALLRAIEEGNIPRSAVNAYHARQIQTYKDKDLNKKLAEVWGRIGSTSAEKKQKIKHWQNQLLPDVLAKGNPRNGQVLYKTLCQGCHVMGKENSLGPDLLGANRRDIYYLLENIIDPSATLPADYQLTVITKKGGSVFSGNVKSENEYSVTLKNLGGEIVISHGEIKSREKLNQSLMPVGLLDNLTSDEVRDLIRFLSQ